MLLRCEVLSEQDKAVLVHVTLLGQLNDLGRLSVELGSLFHELVESLVLEDHIRRWVRLACLIHLRHRAIVVANGCIAMSRLLFDLFQSILLHLGEIRIHGSNPGHGHTTLERGTDWSVRHEDVVFFILLLSLYLSPRS